MKTFRSVVFGVLFVLLAVGVQADTFIAYDSQWRYLDTGADPGSSWNQPSFQDSSWAVGPGLLGAGGSYTSSFVPPVKTSIAPLRRTYYFRHNFTIPTTASGVTLQLSFFADDGAVFFLNGKEVYRARVPAGQNNGTSASQSVGTATVETVAISAADLVPGNNLFAVQLHQNEAAGGVDMVFGALLTGVIRDVVLNEVLADNQGVFDNGGTFPDFIEIYNKSEMAANLSGLHLTDNPLEITRFTFPANATVPPKGYLVVYADSQFLAPGIHTGFGLKSTGGMVGLYEGNIAKDQITFGLQAPNLSVGRSPNGTGTFQLTQVTPGTPNATAPVAASPSPLRINEWMASPASGDDWFELHNTGTSAIRLDGLKLTDDPSDPNATTILPTLSFIASKGHIKFSAGGLNDSTNGADHVNFKLSGAGDSVGIYNGATIINTVTFGQQTNGVSQGRLPDGAAAPYFFFPKTSTPGAFNYLPLGKVIINEALTHTDPPLEDAIEFYNPTNSVLAIGGWWLSDDLAVLQKYQVPAGSSIPAGGFKVFYENQFNNTNNTNIARIPFSLSSSKGDEIILSEFDGSGNFTGYLASQKFGAAVNGRSFGRFYTSDGSDFVPLRTRTFGSDNPTTPEQFRTGNGLPNDTAFIYGMVINEVMYHPITVVGTNVIENPDEEYIELHNGTTQNFPLYDLDASTNTWRLRGAVDYNFPQNVTMSPNSYLLVVGFDPSNSTTNSAFRRKYNVPDTTPIFGPFTGKLSNGGETIELERPDPPTPAGRPDAGFVPYTLAEKVKYSDTAPWPNAKGNGRSLQRIRPTIYGSEPTNWFAQGFSPGRLNFRDSDNDGMSDAYESQYNLNPNSAADANQDFDRDGHTNLQEYRAGTDPTNPNSALRFEAVDVRTSRGAVYFNVVEGKTYTLEYRDSFGAGVWQPLPTFQNITATSTQLVEVEDDLKPQRYYRLVLIF